MSNSNLREIALNSGVRDDLELDVAIIGAGASGLYAAYRLMSDPNNKLAKTHIFEMSHSIAGRLESVSLAQMPIAAEMGGMRYLGSQQIIATLVEQVFKDNLTSVPFPIDDREKVLFYLRKQRLLADAWAEAQDKGEKLQTRYYLKGDDEGFSADQLFNKIVYDVLVADPWFIKNFGNKVSNPSLYNYIFSLTRQEWDSIKPFVTYFFEGPYYGMKLNDIGFWNLIKDQVSQEGYSFLAEAGGYYSNTINWNAAEAFPYMVGCFSDTSIKYKTIGGGFDLIAYALAHHYLKHPDTVIWSENQLLTFQHSKKFGRRYHLVFLNHQTGNTWNVCADHIILALPRRSLELLDQDCVLFKQSPVRQHIESVIIEPSFKLLMGFKSPWWKDLFGVTSGHSITDLPMRQCYYFGTETTDSHSLFLASYNDMQTVTFWKALAQTQLDRFESKECTPFSDHNHITGRYQKTSKLLASKMMVAEAMNQVRELHGHQAAIPDPFAAWYKDWTIDPYGGGYHAWKAGVPVNEIMPFMRCPLTNESIHICGEAYSTQQGWVEGAFCEAEKMLQDHFHLQWPNWLPNDYYLGW